MGFSLKRELKNAGGHAKKAVKKVYNTQKNIINPLTNSYKQIAKGDISGGLGSLAYNTWVNPFMQTGGKILSSGDAQNFYGQMMSGFSGAMGQKKPSSTMPMPSMPEMSTGGDGYPAYPNAFGIGGDMNAQGVVGNAAQSQIGTPNAPITLDLADTGSRGGNPWTFSGEANARGGES